LYVGQGAKRDYKHRPRKSSFGRRFEKRFPGHELPQPIRWTVEIANQLELNELETIAMFQYHSWHGYEGGMNLCLPGASDYANISLLAVRVNASNGTAVYALTREQRSAAGHKGGALTQSQKIGIFGMSSDKLLSSCRKGGRMAVASGRLQEIARVQTRKQKETGTGLYGLTHEQLQEAGRKGRASAASSGHWGTGMLGKHHSAESRAKMSLANKGRTPWNKGKRSNKK
jgi:hypothetical protein